jgi:DNA primase
MEFAVADRRELTVSSRWPLDAKEQIRQAIDIVDLVGSVVQLRRQGRNYVGLCPWHDDSRPSLQVNPERQSFKCWVCDIGGDIFSFIMKTEGVEFPEALAMLADRAGVTLQKPPARQQEPGAAAAPGGAAAPPDKRTLYEAMAWAARQYHECLLNSPEAEPARKYLQDRGITAESIEKFHLGFSPTEASWLLQRAGGTPARARVLELIGLLARPAGGGSLYDRFKGRLLFAIRDVQGRAVGLGGRVLPGLSDSPAKYVNSPETPLFAKSQLLYGLDLARETIRKSRAALVMEGYTDCIVAHQYGFTDAVAVLGTALGEAHVRLLKRFADRIVLVLDGDEAGQRRANEVLELFVAQQVDLRILTLPDELDPCEFLLERGAEAFRRLLETETVDALDHAIRAKTRGIDLGRDVHGATAALEQLVAIIAKAPRLRHDTTGASRLREEKILEQLAARFRVPEAEVRRHLTAVRRKAAVRSPSSAPPSASSPAATAATSWRPAEKIDPWERELLELLLGHPECWPAAAARLRGEHFLSPACREIYQTCRRLLEAGVTPGFDRLMLELDEPALKNLLVELDESEQSKQRRLGDPPALLEALIHTLFEKEAQRQRPGQTVALREGRLDASQEAALLEEMLRQERSRHGISGPTDG